MWQLVINGPGYFDTTYDLPDGVTNIGRADENDIVLSGDLVSRKHAKLWSSPEGLQFEDLGSRNGTKINGEVFTGTREVKAGDTLGVGENSLVVRKPAQSENVPTEMVDGNARGVRRYGKGVDIGQAVVLARAVHDSVVMRVLDNVLPFDAPEPPLPGKVRRKKQGDTDETDDRRQTNEDELTSDGPGAPVAWSSLVTLYKVAERLATAATLQSFLDDTCDLIMKRVGATTGVVLLRHRTGVLVPSSVRHSRALAKGEVPVSEAIVDAAVKQGQAIAVADVRDDARFANRESVVLYDVDQVLCVPIGPKAPFAGVLYLNRPSASGEPVEALLDIATAITQLLATGIQKFSGKPEGQGVRRALERFVAPELAERRATELQGRSTMLDERTVTFLVVELHDLPELLKRLSPDRVADVLGELYRLAQQLIFSFEGVVHQLRGGSLTALFGTPYAKGDDGIRSVRAAMALKAEWDLAMATRPQRERCHLRIGLHTGKALTGTIGTEARIDYVAIGEPEGIAQLVCQSAQPGQLLLTGKTLAMVGARFDVTPLGERALQGSKLRMPIFEVLEEDNDIGTLSGIRPNPPPGK